MSATALYTIALESLKSNDELGLLDAIDNLRSEGVSHYVSLPQLIVCGDQSSGKSSVLEAISGIPFPTKDNLCTRFATELILRRTAADSVSVSIVPSQNRSVEECHRLSQFSESLTEFAALPNLIEKAKDYMGISATSKAFSNDVLRIELSGPSQQHLTIVDLPGLIHSENKLQTSADVELILSMVKSYMANRRSIILAVVAANNDYANQIVTKLAKDVDPKGHRTLGIITKPDTLSAGSESELSYANLARNLDVEFRLGWHVLMNRKYETRNTSSQDRDAAEESFFAQGIWKNFSQNLVGITSLRIRLSQVLLQQIKMELPSLLEEIANNIKEIQGMLEKLGESRDTNEEQRLFLLNLSQSFQFIVNAAVDGSYGNDFFGNPRSVEGYTKRLRAVIQNLNVDFAETMRARGHQRLIMDRAQTNILASAPAPPAQSGTSPGGQEPEMISRTAFLDDVAKLLKTSRGRELPGMFNPLIVGDLFHEQAAPWGQLMRAHLKTVWEAARAFLELVTAHLTDVVTADALLKEVIDPLMEKRYEHMTVKLDELLMPHQKGHPITYNNHFTETIQNMREKRLEVDVTQKLSKLFGVPNVRLLEECDLRKVKMSSLISALCSREEVDMDRYASSEVLDCMLAYYKVTLKSVVDSIATQAVETELIAKLRDLLSPAFVIKMKPELVSKIATESSENRSERERLTRKLVVMQAGLGHCKRHADRPNTSLQRPQWHTEKHLSSDDDLEDQTPRSSPQPEKEDTVKPADDPPATSLPITPEPYASFFGMRNVQNVVQYVDPPEPKDSPYGSKKERMKGKVRSRVDSWGQPIEA